MNGPWEEFQPTAPSQPAPWDEYAPKIAGVKQPKVAKGIVESARAGYQRSLAGLIDRGALPDTVIDPDQNDFWDRNVANISQVVNEGPEMLVAGLATFFATRNRVAAAGAAGFLPANLRTAYTMAIESGEINESTSFLSGLKVAGKYMSSDRALEAGAKEGISNAAVAAVGIGAYGVTGKSLQKLVERGVISKTTAAVGTGAAVAAAEYPTAVLVGPALEGRLPEPYEWADGLAQMLGPKIVTMSVPKAHEAMKSAPEVGRRMMEVWRRTGKKPDEIISDARRDPSIAKDLVKGTEAEQVLREQVKKEGISVQEIDPSSIDLSIFDTVEPSKWKPPVDATEPKAVQAGKDAAKAAVKQEFASGSIPENAAFRGLYIEELMEIAETKRLPIRSNAEGESVIPATPVTRGEFDGAAYGAGSGYVVPREKTTASGLAGEVHVDPRTDPTQLRYVVNGKVLSFEQMKAEVLGPTGKRPKTADELAADAWLRENTKGMPEILTLPEAYRQEAGRVSALDAVPGTKAKEVIESPFAHLPELKQKHHLNFKYVEGPEDLKALTARVSEVFEPEINRQRAVSTWEQISNDAALQLQGHLGPDSVKVLLGRNPGDPVNARQLAVYKIIIGQAALESSIAIKKVQEAGGWSSAPVALQLEAMNAVSRHAGIQADMIGATSEAARTLNYAKHVTQLAKEQGDLRTVMEMYGKDPDVMFKMLADADSPQQLSRLVNEATKPTNFQKFIEYYRASLMSGFLTVGYNIGGNTSRLLYRDFLVEPAAVLGEFLSRPENRTSTIQGWGGRIYGTYFVAPYSMVRSAAKAFNDGGVKQVAGEAWKAGQEISIPPVNTGVVGKFTKAVFGTNSMLDVMYRELNTQGSLWSDATNMALKEGHQIGTKPFLARVKEIVENPTEVMLENAKREADAGVFATPLGEFGQRYQQMTGAGMGQGFQFIVPFTRTPVNIFKDIAKGTPFAPLIDTWQADFQAGGARKNKAIAEMAVGNALLLVAYGLAQDGRITGGGDPDPRKKAVQMQSGWQPYSIKMQDGTYVPLTRISPQVGTLLGISADLAQLKDYMTPEDEHKAGKMALLTFKNAVTNQMMLKGVTDVLAALEDDNKTTKYLQSTAGSLIPASGMLGQLASSKDPYAREINSILDAIKYKIPGARETLEPKVSAFGENVKERELSWFLSPIKTSKQTEDKVLLEAARLKIGASKPPKTVDVGIHMGRIGMVELTPEQKTKFARTAGELAYKIADPLVNSQRWETMADLKQQMILEEALSGGRQLANVTTLTPEQLQKEVSIRSQRLQTLLEDKPSK